jgi:tetratricopeptide (TPR) repeat protein
MSDAEAYPRALAAARQAIVLDPSSPDAHRSIAFVLRFWNWDMVAAEKEYLRAIELDPKNSQSHHWYATALFSAGRLKEALVQIDLARALEPQSVSVLADRGLILSFEDPERGAEALRQVSQSQPEFVSAHSYLSRVYLTTGDYARFLSEARLTATLSHESDQVAILDKARKDLDTRGPVAMLRNLALSSAPLADNGKTSAYSVARLFGIAGDSGHALHYLQMACDRRDPGFLSFESDAAFRQVRTTPEYLALLARKDALPIARLDRPKPF